MDLLDLDDVGGEGKYLGGVRRVINILLNGKKVSMKWGLALERVANEGG